MWRNFGKKGWVGKKSREKGQRDGEFVTFREKVKFVIEFCDWTNISRREPIKKFLSYEHSYLRAVNQTSSETAETVNRGLLGWHNNAPWLLYHPKPLIN